MQNTRRPLVVKPETELRLKLKAGATTSSRSGQEGIIGWPTAAERPGGDPPVGPLAYDATAIRTYGGTSSSSTSTSPSRRRATPS